jgi:hypothetical protein
MVENTVALTPDHSMGKPAFSPPSASSAKEKSLISHGKVRLLKWYPAQDSNLKQID